jgi:hypothetical protein
VLFRFLETPVIDILLLLLFVRFLFPQFLGVRRRKQEPPADQFISNRQRNKQPASKKDEGEYIEYEEIR